MLIWFCFSFYLFYTFVDFSEHVCKIRKVNHIWLSIKSYVQNFTVLKLYTVDDNSKLKNITRGNDYQTRFTDDSEFDSH